MMKFAYMFLMTSLCLASAGLCPAADAPASNKTVTATYHVPSKGKIMDVTYRPEYDQWWVKCREKDDVTIYTFDEYSKQWGCVVFTTNSAPPEKKTEKPAAKKTIVKPEAKSDNKKPQPEKIEKKDEKTSESAKPTEPKESTADNGKKDGKWITPFDMLKKGADIFRRKPEEKK